jgi:hypothetical protein
MCFNRIARTILSPANSTPPNAPRTHPAVGQHPQANPGPQPRPDPTDAAHQDGAPRRTPAPHLSPTTEGTERPATRRPPHPTAHIPPKRRTTCTDSTPRQTPSPSAHAPTRHAGGQHRTDRHLRTAGTPAHALHAPHPAQAGTYCRCRPARSTDQHVNYI